MTNLAASGLSPCAEIVRQGDYERFRTALFAGAHEREYLFALYAFNLEVAKVAPMVSEPMIGEIRYQWWRDTLDMIFGGGQVRRHEVVDSLTLAIRGAELPRAPFDALIDARSRDLDPAFPADEGALEAYLADTAGALTQLAGRSLGAKADEAAKAAGIAIGTARYLKAIPALLAAGKRPIPGQDIDWPAIRKGGTSDALAEAIGRFANGGLTAVAQARRSRSKVPRSAVPAFMELANAHKVLNDLSQKADSLDATVNAGASPFRDNLSRLWRGVAGRW